MPAGSMPRSAGSSRRSGNCPAPSVRQGHDERVEEFSDVLAWLVTLADLCGVDIAEAAARYRDGCPSCGGIPCTC
jgi:hypothetical protein